MRELRCGRSSPSWTASWPAAARARSRRVTPPLGVVLAGTDPVAVDLAAIRLMGFDERNIPKVKGPMQDEGPRITRVRSPEDVSVVEARAGDEVEFGSAERTLDEITADEPFEPHHGWRGHIERR